MKSGVVSEIKRESIERILLLSVVTFTLYWAFWLRRNTQCVNRYLTDDKIPWWFFPLFVTITLLNFGLLPLEVVCNYEPSVSRIRELVIVLDVAVGLSWVFALRNRLNSLVGSGRTDVRVFRAAPTLFLHIFYLQYRLNELKRRAQVGNEPEEDISS